jgi:hypothetical protein
METEKNDKESFVHRQEEMLTSSYASALGLVRAADFFPRVAHILSRAESLGLSCSGLSVFLLEENSFQATHYYLHPSPIGWQTLSLAEDSVEVEVLTTRKANMRQSSSAGRSLWHLTVPSTLGVVTVTDHRQEGFSPAEGELVEELARSLEILALRHRDLYAREMSDAKITQVDASLVALFNGSFELAGETSDEVIRRILQMVIAHLAFDRAGIFLINLENDILQGAWGVDEKGEMTPISTTVFPPLPRARIRTERSGSSCPR